jgi:hypothetical protein
MQANLMLHCKNPMWKLRKGGQIATSANCYRHMKIFCGTGFPPASLRLLGGEIIMADGESDKPGTGGGRISVRRHDAPKSQLRPSKHDILERWDEEELDDGAAGLRWAIGDFGPEPFAGENPAAPRNQNMNHSRPRSGVTVSIESGRTKYLLPPEQNVDRSNKLRLHRGETTVEAIIEGREANEKELQRAIENGTSGGAPSRKRPRSRNWEREAAKQEGREKRSRAIQETLRRGEPDLDERGSTRAEEREALAMGRKSKVARRHERAKDRTAAERTIEDWPVAEAGYHEPLMYTSGELEEVRESARDVEHEAKRDWREEVGSREVSGLGWNTHRRKEAANAEALAQDTTLDATHNTAFQERFTRPGGLWHPLDREQVNSKNSRYYERAAAKEKAQLDAAAGIASTSAPKRDHDRADVKAPPTRGR